MDKFMWKRLKFNIGKRLVIDWLFTDWERATYYMLDLLNWARCKMSQRDYEKLLEKLRSESFNWKR